MENWTHFMKVRSHVLKSLEEARNQKYSSGSLTKFQTSSVVCGITGVINLAKRTVKQELDNLGADVREALIVSQLDIADLADAPGQSSKLLQSYVALLVSSI